MVDQWYFEIGDGGTYGPYPMEKLQKWAAAGNLMPTHRVRRADSTEWTIAAYVPGLELTTKAEEEKSDGAEAEKRSAFARLLSRGKGAAEAEEEVDVVELCDELLEKAFRRGASDVHVDPEENVTLVQLRVDGELETIKKLPSSLHPHLLGRLKILSRMDIAERRQPQDGQFTRELGPDDQRVHIRAACLPTTHGERMTLRLLALETAQLTLNKLGMSDTALHLFSEHAGLSQGMVVLTGPTGSGKSTTLYAAIRHRLANHPGRIITVEDPVEFDIVGVAQAEVDAAEKLGFSTVLRNILRSDPDVIMIGEIRDLESADIAIKAALSGHLVLSSLHTNSAAGVVTRLIDMGLEPYQVAATIRLCVAQRLVRRLCPKCRRPRELTPAEAQAIGKPDAAGAIHYAPAGCPQCNQRGYRGRIGVFELLPVDDELSRRIVDGANEGEIARHARERGLPSLREDGVLKLLGGTVSLNDLLSVGTR